MNYNNIKILISVARIEQLPPILPEIVFAGRSNVGKSSLINKLLNRKNFARTSSTPGKTATINFYVIDDMIYFTDLPGYGFAKVSKTEKLKWGELLEGYFKESREIALAILLVDIRHEPSDDDKDMALWLKASGHNFIVCATKNDKIKKTQIDERITDIRAALELSELTPVIPFSAQNGEGKQEIIGLIEKLVGETI